MKRPHPPRSDRRRQQGLASLVVVMVLLFAVALAAAYTNRNLIFEQRTSANQYRSTQGLETAQAGLEWAVAMLNGGRIDDSCQPSATLTDASFRERYLAIDTATGVITPRANPGGGDLASVCVYDGSAWSCSCPSSGATLPPAPAGVGIFPAYRVRFALPVGAAANAPGVIRIEVAGCPRLDNDCLDFGNPQGAEGRGRIAAVLGLFGGLKSAPAAALTAREAIALDAGATVVAANGDIPSGGVAVQSGLSIAGGLTATGIAGSPVNALVPDEPWLRDLTATVAPALSVSERLFATTFGVTPATWRAQAGAVTLSGCPCTATDLRDLIARNPGRPVWVAGDLALDSAGEIGSAAAPVSLVVDGNVTATAAGVTVHGLLYVRRSPRWTLAGSATVVGAAIAENGLDGTGGWQFLYEPPTLTAVRTGSGTFAVVNGSWKDFVE